MESSIKKEILSWVFTIVLAVALALLIRIFLFEIVQVKQTSMVPTLNDGDRVFVSNITYRISDPEFQDIVVIKIDKETRYVKRVIGMPGDSVQIVDSKVYVNGKQIDEPYLSDDIVYEDYPLTTVPEGSYFVMGDNRPSSIDSRDPSVGLISREQFKSKVLFRVYPFSAFGNVE